VNQIHLRVLLRAKDDPSSQERFRRDLLRVLDKLGIEYETTWDHETGKRVIEFPDECVLAVMKEMEKYRYVETYEIYEENGKLVKKKIIERRW